MATAVFEFGDRQRCLWVHKLKTGPFHLTTKQANKLIGRLVPREGDECWGWSAGHDMYGYPVTHTPGVSTVRVSRVLSASINGDDIRGLCACHDCDNVACVNPNLLWPGTKGQNNTDRARKGTCLAGQALEILAFS